ncbi:hypothetical protein FBY28_4897 [Arthrobacter sp. SLBN-53]|nr:hypothetical protein FBY28_4897 [Arthrobacter sp. SLBN-53]
MIWWLVAASPRVRILFNAGWALLWSLGYGAATLVPLGVHGVGWWLSIVGVSVLVAVAVAVLTAWSSSRFGASTEAVLGSLNADQRRQVARVWRRGPVPADPVVLTAALRLHDIVESSRQATRRSRIVAGSLIGAGVVMILVGAALSKFRTLPGSGPVLVALAVVAVVLGASALGARRRRPRLAHLRAVAQSDPEVAAAVAQADPAPVTRAQRLRWAIAVFALVGVWTSMLKIGVWMSPHRAGCRAVTAVVGEVYHNRYVLLRADAVKAGGPALSQFQELSDSLRRKADGDYDADTALHLDRIAVLAVQAVGVVERARQPENATSPDALADNRHAYLVLLDALMDEEEAAQEQCRR